MVSGTVELRVLGTKEQLLESIRERAEAELGIRMRYIALDGMSALQRAITQPDSFDVYDQCTRAILRGRRAPSSRSRSTGSGPGARSGTCR